MSLAKKKKSTKEKNCYDLEIAVEKDVFAAALDEAFKKKAADIALPGFRKGKAPRAIIERMYGKGFFYEDAINACIPDAYEAAIKESKLDIVGQPEFDVDNLSDDGFTLKVKVFVKPEVKIEDYLGIEIEKKIADVTDEEIDAEIERVRERNSRTIEITDRAAKMGDSVNIDFDGSVDGVHFDGGKAEGFDLKLGSGQFIPGFEEQIVDHAIGDAFDVNVSFPAEYHAEELAGKPAVFAVKLNGIKETELPALDDEFAKDVSEFDTFAEYRADIQAKIKERHEKTAESEFEDKLIDTLIEKMEADIPEVMFVEETENFYRDYENRMKMQGLDIATYFKYTGMTADSLKAQLRPQAEKQVKVRLILETIAKREKLSASAKEIEAEYKRIGEAYNMPTSEIKALIPKESIAADMKVKAAMDLVKEKAIVK